MNIQFDSHKIKMMEKIYKPDEQRPEAKPSKDSRNCAYVLVLILFLFSALFLCTYVFGTRFSSTVNHVTIYQTFVQSADHSTDKKDSMLLWNRIRSKLLSKSHELKELRSRYNSLKSSVLMDMKRRKSSFSIHAENPTIRPDPELHMTTCEIVNRWGYKCENHSVTTDDGYILTLHRVPSTMVTNGTNKPYPVFLQHGLLASSADWIDNMPNISLAYLLADHGYDVWMGNFRGNYYSRKHLTLSPDERAFWRFSWDEMASHDLPAMIHYVLNKTNHQDLFYAGHSQGTMTAFAEFSRNQELGRRIRMFFALAPVTTVGHMTDLFANTLAPFANEIRDLLYVFGSTGEFLPRGSKILDWLNEHVCITTALEFICEDFLWFVAGIHANELNATRIPVYLSQTPAGTSLENVVHFGQMVMSKKFQMYNYGNDKENLAHYNQTQPPLYDVRPLKTPITLYWGGEDWLADPNDVTGLIKKLNHIDHNKFIPNYDHLDFLWATTAADKIYNDMLNVMKSRLNQ